jgi:hypothetical protein
MGHYLLRLREGSADFESYTHHLIEAEDEQMVKYHYHHTMRDWGYGTTSWGDKHSLEVRQGLWAELDRISELSQLEYEVLSEYVEDWHKTADN